MLRDTKRFGEYVRHLVLGVHMHQNNLSFLIRISNKVMSYSYVNMLRSGNGILCYVNCACAVTP